MKKVLFLLIATLMSATTITAQKTVVSNKQSKETAFDVVEKMPEYPGGQMQMMTFLMENMKYPKEAQSKKIEGRVIVTFIVEKDGMVTEAEVVKSVYPALDEEALRVVSIMPKWQPGMQKGKPVRVKYTIPITFRLS